MSSVTALIPVREGSKRLKDKNISRFAGTNLLLYKIEQLKRVKSIDNIIVSTDSEVMLNTALGAGVNIQVRPLEYCDEKTKSFSDVVEWVTSNITGEHVL